MSQICRSRGYLLLDGAVIEPALAWCYQHLPQCEPVPLLHDTEYESLMDLGPLLIESRPGDPADRHWQQPQGPLNTAVWLESALPVQAIQKALQRRLQVFRPTGDAIWLRLYDARPLLRVQQAGLTFPQGFWYGVSSVWLPGRRGPFTAWQNPALLEDAAPKDLAIAPQITLNWPLLQALANTDMEIHA